MPFKVLPGVRYRIQNVDLGTYVEQRGKSSLVMRPFKDDSTRQQWTFVKDLRDDFYVIKNHGTSLVFNGKMNAEVGTLSNVRESDSKAKWRFIEDAKQKSVFYILSQDLGDDESEVLFHIKDDSSLSLIRDYNLEDLDRIARGEEFRWRVIEDSAASLPDASGDGMYRIRTLTGQTIGSERGKTTLTTKNQARGDHRAWDITSKGNGKCILFNAQEKLYLGAAKDGRGNWAPFLSRTEQLWDIRSTSDFTYSICITLEIPVNTILTPNRFALSLGDDVVILKLMKAAHNQLWLIEATDAPVTTPSRPPPGGGGTGEVVPGLRAGNYFLRNNGRANGYYVETSLTSTGQIEILAGTLDGAMDFAVKAIDSGEAVITFTGGAYLANIGGTLGQQRDPYTWIIESEPVSKRYYICDSNNPQYVLSAPVTGNKFPLQQKSNTATNLWNFTTPS